MRRKIRGSSKYAILALTLAAAATSLVSVAPAASASGEECWKADAAELRLLEKVNQSRAENGLEPVTLDAEISKVAQHHSYQMKLRGTPFHTPTYKLNRRVTNFQTLGETVGKGSSVDSVHLAFMNSSAHRHVFLSEEFEHAGVGISYDGGRIWVTVLFEARTDPGTTMAMPDC